MSNTIFNRLINSIRKNQTKIIIALLGLAFIASLARYLYINNALSLLSVADNILSETLGILVTLYFVQALFNREEKKRKRILIKQVQKQITQFTRGSLTQLVLTFGFDGMLKFGLWEPKEIDDRLFLDEALLDTHVSSDDNIYIRMFSIKIPYNPDYSLLEAQIRDGDYILHVFGDQLEPETFNRLFVCLKDLKRFIKYPPKIKAKKYKKKGVKRRGMRGAYPSATVYNLSNSLSHLIVKLHDLDKFVNSPEWI